MSAAKNPWRTDKVYRTRAQVEPFVRTLEDALSTFGEVKVCGSWRRGAELIGDLDVVIVNDECAITQQMIDAIAEVLPEFVYERGGENGPMANAHLTLEDGELHLDLYAAVEGQRGAMLWFLTGPKNLNIQMRAEAGRKGWMLNQYGLWGGPDHDQQVDDGSEADIGRKLGFCLQPRDRQQFAEPVNRSSTKTVLSSDGVTTYTVTFDGASASCTCPGYKYRRRCRHIQVR